MYAGLWAFDTLHKIPSCLGVRLCIMLEGNFRELRLDELRTNGVSLYAKWLLSWVLE
jgi:hypothetical protein